jgi:hypothetical protein
MRKFRTAAATLAATGLAVFGVATASGVANAKTHQAITSCSVGSGVIVAGIAPKCTASNGTINNPTQVTVRVNPSFFSALSGLPIIGSLLATDVTYTLACSVGGKTKTAAESYTATSAMANTQVLNLQKEIGSPAPNWCQIRDLTASAPAAIVIPLGAIFTFGVTATGNNGTPGEIWAQYPGSGKAPSTVCVDDTANGNAGTVVQAFQCENDLADGWIVLPNGQFVHNGDCLTNSKGTATLEHCVAKPGPASSQVWVAHGAPGKFGRVTSASDDGCLSAKSMGKVDGSALTVKHCVSGKLGQYWKVPAATRVYA